MNLRKGSVTVEASIVLPIFISVFISVAFFIKAVYVHEIIQYSITEAANEMAEYSYLYHVSGLQGVDDEAKSGLKSKAKLFQEHLNTILDSYNNLKSFSDDPVETLKEGKQALENGDIGQVINDANETAAMMKSAKENFDNVINVARDVRKNPLEEFKSIACMIAGGAFEDIKTELCIPIVKYYISGHLKAEGINSADERLRKLNIVNGFEGLDFNDSSFFADEENNIDVVVKYKLSIPVPFKVLPELRIVQRATAKAWLGGDEENGEGDSGNKDDKGNIWLLSNFERGKKIREIFGGNLPDKFPVIAKFDSAAGKAVMIKSMDLTGHYYQTPKNVEDKVNEYLNELRKFKGGKSAGTQIVENQIKSKEMILVIPEEAASPEVRRTLDRCIEDALGKGIVLKVEEYGKKPST